MTPLQFVTVHQSDPLAAPLIDDLAREYGSRYGHAQLPPEYQDMRAYPATQFEPPAGDLVIALRDGVSVAGGAFQRFDERTAELKRIWTAAEHRQRGYGRAVVAELERRAAARGYRRVVLTTGWRQPEAVALYLSLDYLPCYDTTLAPEEVGPHTFAKELSADLGPR